MFPRGHHCSFYPFHLLACVVFLCPPGGIGNSFLLAAVGVYLVFDRGVQLFFGNSSFWVGVGFPLCVHRGLKFFHLIIPFAGLDFVLVVRKEGVQKGSRIDRLE